MTLKCFFVIAILLVQTSISHADGCLSNSDCGEWGACNLGTCVCPFGTYGPTCTKTCVRDVDCNEGTCTLGKVCDCPLLQTGKHCENTNECDLSFTCVNDMECDQSSEPYRCVEPVVTNPSTAVTIAGSGPAILLVQTRLSHADGCLSNSECGEGGACNLGTCVCPFGTYGPTCTETCERDVDCNEGTCTLGKVCDCPLLQTGKHCENTNECDLSFTCVNDMECDQSSEPYRCVEPVVTNPSTAVTIAGSGPECNSGTTRNIASTIELQLFILGMISLISTV